MIGTTGRDDIPDVLERGVKGKKDGDAKNVVPTTAVGGMGG